MANLQKNLIWNKKAIGFRPLLISLIIVMLFSFFLFEFAFNFLLVTNPSSEMLCANCTLNTSMIRIGNSLQGFEDLSANIKNQTLSGKAEASNYLFLIFQGAFEIPKTIMVFAGNAIVSLGEVFFIVSDGTGLGRALSISITIIIAVLTITFALLVVQFIRTGQSER